MSITKSYLVVAMICTSALAVQSYVAASESKYSLESSICRLLKSKLMASNPWIVYPIVFEPINRGRLTVWTGVSSLPTSEFDCSTSQNSTNQIILSLAQYVNKLDWTFYDKRKGATLDGVSINHCENVDYKITIKNRQADSHLDCNIIENIELLDRESQKASIQSTCKDCNQSLLPLIEGQIKELIKMRLDEQVMDNLHWHLSQLISSQHFVAPTSV